MSICGLCGARLFGNVGHACSQPTQPTRPYPLDVDVVGIINRNAAKIRDAVIAKRLQALAHNLYVAAALCTAYDLGVCTGIKLVGEKMNGDWSPEPLWVPGRGKAAP